jgi:hypothetical protein
MERAPPATGTPGTGGRLSAHSISSIQVLKQKERMMKRFATSALLLAVLALPSIAALDSGMALVSPMSSKGLFIRYLSTGADVTVVGANVRHACFSPDGKKIAYLRDDVDRLRTVNIDGTDDVEIARNCGGARGTPQWCTDGYIYWEKGKIYRVPETGGTPEDLIGEWRYDLVSPTGDTLGGGGHAFNGMQMDRAGTRAVGTAQKTTGGYAQRAYDVLTDTEHLFVRPCQEGMSPSGNLVSVSYSGHRFYRIVPWRVEFADYGDNGNTYEGCTFDGEIPGHCPDDYDTSLSIANDIQAQFCPATRVDNIGMPRFSDHEEDIFLFKVNPGEAGDEAVGCYAYDFTTHEYTQLYADSSTCWGFIREEITMGTQHPYTLTPSSASFAVEVGGSMPASQSLVLASTPVMSSAPTVSGAPAWLNVSSTRVSDHEYTISLSLVETEVPSEGSYEATLGITPDGSTDSLTATVSLTVALPPPPPIVIHTPAPGASYQVGDTLRITYSADSTIVSGVVIKLTVDGGDQLVPIRDDDALPAGANKTYEYVIPDTITALGTPVSTISNICFVQLSNYPEGNETLSPLFSITAAGTSVSRGKAGAGWTIAQLRAARVPSSEGTESLRIDAPRAGNVALYDLGGRLVKQFAVRCGRQVVHLDAGNSGSLLMRASYIDGGTESVRLHPN